MSASTSFSLRSAAGRKLRHGGPRAFAATVRDFLRARWLLRSASSLGAVRIVGRVRLVNNGAVHLGDRILLEGTTVPIEIAALGGTITIGDGSYVNYGSSISSTDRVDIGANVAIGQYAIIMDNDQHAIGDHRRPGRSGPIVIEDDVWLGARVIVLRGSHIGRGAVIGANSLVKGTIPPYTLAAGSPARVIRHLTEAELGGD